MADELKICCNRGCNKRYSERENDGITTECIYHSGIAYFHDAYKGWTCCQQKSTDFTTFLNFKGCKTGKHSEKEEKKELIQKSIIESKIETKIENKSKIEYQFEKDIWNQLDLIESKSVINDNEDIVEKKKKNKSKRICRKCRKILAENEDKEEECVYHFGQTIFHDSLKYWTCCPNKKFTDFDDFEQLVGCTRADQHEPQLVGQKPRVDWFQTNDVINIIIYGLKGVRRASIGQQSSRVSTNGQSLRCVLCDAIGSILFEEEWLLSDYVEKSADAKVLIDRSKVEINLRKINKNKYWNQLTK